MTARVCSITAGSAATFRDRPAFAGYRNLFLIQRFSNGRISDLRNIICTNFRCPIYARSGRRRTPDRTSGGARPSVARVSGGRWQIYSLPTETRKAPAPISPGLRTTPVSLLTGAGRFLITSFRRAPPEPRPKCDRVHFKQKNTLDSLANLKFGDVRAIYNFGRRSLDMWRRHSNMLEQWKQKCSKATKLLVQCLPCKASITASRYMAQRCHNTFVSNRYRHGRVARVTKINAFTGQAFVYTWTFDTVPGRPRNRYL